MLFRALAVRLALFGRVDAREADPVLLMGCVEESERIAVGDGDDLAEELRRAGRPAQDEPDEGDMDDEAASDDVSFARECAPAYALWPGLFTLTAVGTSP